MEKITVVECVQDAENGGYKIRLSDGTNRTVRHAAPVGAEWMDETPVAQTPKIEFLWDQDARELTVMFDSVEQYHAPFELFGKLVDDNAMLQRGLDEANAALASLSEQNGRLAEEILRLKHEPAMLKALPSLVGVTTRDVSELPPLDALQPHPTMEPPDVEIDTRTDVEKHLDAKRDSAAKAAAYAEQLTAEPIEGAKGA